MNNNEGTEFVAKYSGKYRHFKKTSYLKYLCVTRFHLKYFSRMI